MTNQFQDGPQPEGALPDLGLSGADTPPHEVTAAAPYDPPSLLKTPAPQPTFEQPVPPTDNPYVVQPPVPPSYPSPPPGAQADAFPPPGGYAAPYGQPAGYGQPGPYGQPTGYPAAAWGAPSLPPRSNGLAIASLIIGCVSLVLCFLGILTGIVAVVLGIVAITQVNNSQGRTTGTGLAIAGVATGAVASLIWLVVFVAS